MHAVPRPLELRLLLPLVILVPLGFAVTHIAQTGTDQGDEVEMHDAIAAAVDRRDAVHAAIALR